MPSTQTIVIVAMKPLTLCALLALIAWTPTQAQSSADIDKKALTQRPDAKNPVGPNLEVPPAWKVRLDAPDASVTVGKDESFDIRFVTMTPGWHVTTGPRAIFYHPASTARGEFTARVGIYLFPPGKRNEAYGMFIGGKALEAPEQSYTYFLVRRSGEFLIKRRAGDKTEVLHPWTRHDAVTPYLDDTEGTIHNVLEINAGPTEVAFLVNGKEVARRSRAEIDVEGLVGLRINHALNLHVDELTVDMRSGGSR